LFDAVDRPHELGARGVHAPRSERRLSLVKAGQCLTEVPLSGAPFAAGGPDARAGRIGERAPAALAGYGSAVAEPLRLLTRAFQVALRERDFGHAPVDRHAPEPVHQQAPPGLPAAEVLECLAGGCAAAEAEFREPELRQAALLGQDYPALSRAG